MKRRTSHCAAISSLLLLACGSPSASPGLAGEPGPVIAPAQIAPAHAAEAATANELRLRATEATAATAAQATGEDPRRAEAVRAVQTGDLERAHALLVELLVEQYTDAARVHLAAREPDGALRLADRALTLDPDAREALLVQGEGNFLLAERMIAGGSGGGLVLVAFEDALASFERAGDGPEALLGASRAARQLDRAEESYDYARRAVLALEGRPDPEHLREPVRRTLSEAAFLAYVRAKQAATREAEAGTEQDAELLAEQVATRFRLAEGALGEFLGEAGVDPWVWNTLATLYEFEGRYDDARSTLMRGLDRVPTDAALLTHYADVARTGGGGGFDESGALIDLAAGRTAAVDALERFLARHPDVAGAWYALGWERFELALSAPFEERDPAAFAAAESDFRAGRERDAALEEACRRYEVVCRAGVGWAHYSAGDLEAAEAAFRSMNDVLEGGLAWSVGDRLGSGLTGLEFVASGYSEASDGYEGPLFTSPMFLPRAAAIYDDLAAAEPDNSDYANNAGFFHRDAATELELLGRTFCRAARGEIGDAATIETLRTRGGLTQAPGSPEESAAFVMQANEALGLAREHVRKSYAAYRNAATLSPDDVRVVNDTALIAVYYLREDLQHAEELLRHAIELGEQQLAADDLDEQARWELENAWGDAWENLGVYTYHYLADPRTARTYFARSVEIGPEPRPLITDVYLRRIDGEELTPSALHYLDAFLHWGEDCAP